MQMPPPHGLNFPCQLVRIKDEQVDVQIEPSKSKLELCGSGGSLEVEVEVDVTAILQPSMVTLLTIHRQKTVLQGARAFGRKDINSKHGFGDFSQTSNMKGSLFEHEILKASKKSRKKGF